MQVNLRVVILRSSLFHIKHSGVGQKTLFLKWRKHLISCCTNHKANRNYWNTTPSTHIPTTGNPGQQCFTCVGCLSFFILMVCLSGMVTWNTWSFLQFLDQNSLILQASFNCNVNSSRDSLKTCHVDAASTIHYFFINLYITFFYTLKIVSQRYPKQPSENWFF